MPPPFLKLRLDEPSRTYHPGEVLHGSFSVVELSADDVTAIELSVLWHTEGKGDEDMSVHHFERLSPVNGQPLDLTSPQSFSTVLPNSPLSYRGLIVKICWRVRLRVFLARGKQLSLEVPFRLGKVPDAREVEV
ncbi:MAG TPA: hypothetical protein VHV08_00905 [Pirellulales bacterium]|jgi:hypothetical protein|nr:hypothetical protein [Pirellulales bacterium]